MILRLIAEIRDSFTGFHQKTKVTDNPLHEDGCDHRRPSGDRLYLVSDDSEAFYRSGGGKGRTEFRMKVRSDATRMNAAKSGPKKTESGQADSDRANGQRARIMIISSR